MNSCIKIRGHLNIILRKFRQKSTEANTLILLHVLFRHGDRTPCRSHSYPTDPHQHLTYFPIGWGNLTNAGKQRCFKLGNVLRQRYKAFVGNYFIHQTLEAWSTDFERTQMSLQLVLTSLYPPNYEQIWNKTLDWQPVPYNFVRRASDDLLLSGINHPEYLPAYIKYQKQIGLLEKYKDLFKYLTENTGRNVTNIRDVWKIMFNLQIQEEFGLILPPWCKSVWPSPIKDLGKMEYSLSVATPKLRDLAIGKFMMKVLNDTHNRIEKQSKVKLYLYSIHEKNVGQVLISLNMYNKHIPKYASCVVIEVHKGEPEHVVKVFYQQGPDTDFVLQRLGDGSSCRLSKFTDLVENYLKIHVDLDFL